MVGWGRYRGVMSSISGGVRRGRFAVLRGGRRAVALATLAAVVAAGCSGSDESTDADGSGVESTIDVADTSITSDSVFDPENPEGTAAPIPGTAPVLDDDVIIATEDGQIPTTTTEPPLDPDAPDAPPTTSANPAPTTAPATVALPPPDEVLRIVSLSPTHTETMFALGLGDFVVAVDSRSDFPVEARAVRDGELNADEAQLDKLLAYEPDVVLIGEDFTDLAGRLGAQGVAAFVGPPATSLDDVYAQIRGIADIVDQPELAQDLVASMQFEIGRIQASLPSGTRTYFHEIDPSLVTILPGSFLDSVYGELGLTSIVPAEPGNAATVTQVSPNVVLDADPDVIILADAECCGVTADVVAGRTGWSSLSAVSNGAVVELTDAQAFRWGPRVVDLVRAVAGGVVAAG